MARGCDDYWRESDIAVRPGLTRRTYRWRMVEPEVLDWDEWEHGKTYQLSNDELVGALLSEVSALRKRVKALEESQPGR